ncbi:hypothetical protein [Pseudoduganella armeniaca]|uniref:hypothetical protein n=1 Tax=Pseudoduganella armeniaca TaxID=2072590 RepID=UPI0011B20162|nr:hypothetical protein [Pseudoduganella armeniaca]
MIDKLSTLDFNVLSHCYLEMISFGPATTRFDFSRPQKSPGDAKYNVTLCVEGKLSYGVGESKGQRVFDDPATCAPLISLLLCDVTRLAKVGDASLRIEFSEDWIQADVDPDAEFESYSLYLSSGDIFIV